MRFHFAFLLALLGVTTSAQDTYFTRTAHVHLKTSNRLMDVEADNYQVFAQLNINTGEIAFTALIKSFEFQLGAANRIIDSKALNVSQHPKAKFEGKIANLSQIDLKKPGNYRAKVEGTLYVWDEKRNTAADALITVKPDGSVYARSNFIMIIEEKNVDKVNKLMREKLPAILSIDTESLGISRNIYVDLDMVLKP
ncbi:hypothetical protein [Flavilitoribacter nigricans]|uniref:YceI family protein n=1 Tax=Flavilitoribacter nigricans (strain ATCC 23147 / DSM 23189 / NBRC 102662 / NCIMB 1420 / SS-2) TaxID=1122177 RepID=A0A2D0N7E7_FLAN2|nr:hypothetical protein [Flavilitoribacter nigricans]PHN04425.1 hypothetical protein CRP01_20665 [Flavilitoribacter nigricans DSM 23189 = NBRC 102662]